LSVKTEHGKQSNTQVELIGVSGFLLGELRKPLDQSALPLGSERLDFSGLAALASSRAFANPTFFDESLKEGIDQIVVKVGLAGDESGALLEGIAVFRAVKQDREQ